MMWFEICGHALVVDAPDDGIRAALDGVPLCLHNSDTPFPAVGTIRFRTSSPAQLEALAAPAMARDGRRLRLPAASESGLDAQLLVGPAEIVLHCGAHGMVMMTSDGTASEVTVTDPAGLAAAVLAAFAVLAMVAERGFSPIHASLVERDGAGVMFCGERSRGKTSSCLALARAGWVVRSDDRCFIHIREGAAMVWGPGGAVRLRPDAARLWPDLRRPMSQGRDWAGKRVVELASVGGCAAAGNVVCRAILFPQVAGTERHHVEPMGRADALHEMLGSTGLAALPAHAAMQFHDLTALLEQTPCYHLRLGRNMDALPEVIAEVLE